MAKATKKARKTPSQLGEYRRKRNFSASPEPPPGSDVVSGGARFVIQEHSATRLHWDLRLERDGVAVSWAVPNGIPEVPGENRMAVHTEDHPLEYLSWEGVIPKGSYGAGTMKVWDSGTYDTPSGPTRRQQSPSTASRSKGSTTSSTSAAARATTG